MENRTLYTNEQLAGFERLSEVLVKVPSERIPQVDAKAAIFVAGMEAAARVAQAVQPAAQLL